MIYPTGYKRNNRYRGPIESFKVNMTNIEIKQNLDILCDALNKYTDDAISIQSSITSQDRFDIRNVKINLSDDIKTIKEGVILGYK